MGDFLQTLFNALAYFWPFRIVNQWEKGLYIVNGTVVRPWRIMRWSRGPVNTDGSDLCDPGLYLTIPWFVVMHEVNMCWDVVNSERLDVVLKDNRTLTVSVVAMMRVTDPVAAYLGFQDYSADRVGLLRATVADELSSAESERFAPDRRGMLLGRTLLAAVQKMGKRIGHEVEDVQVTSFILQPKALRLLS